MPDEDKTKEKEGGNGAGSHQFTAEELKALKSVPGALARLGGGLGTVLQRLEKLEKIRTDESAKKANKKDDNEDSEEGLTDDEIDNLSNAQLVRLLGKQFKNTLEKHVGTVAKSVEELQQGLNTKDFITQFKDLSKEHKDLPLWKDEIVKYYEKYPEAELEDAYYIVRRKNPEKSKAIDAKLKEKEEEGKKKAAEEKEQADAEKRRGKKGSTFSLSPSGTGNSQKPTKREWKNFKAEVADIWDKAAAATGYNADELEGE